MHGILKTYWLKRVDVYLLFTRTAVRYLLFSLCSQCSLLTVGLVGLVRVSRVGLKFYGLGPKLYGLGVE